MTRSELADRLEHYAAQVSAIRGVGRNGPHAFVEDKSEIVAAMNAEARELRGNPAPQQPASNVAAIAPGSRLIGSRKVQVERRAERLTFR